MLRIFCTLQQLEGQEILSSASQVEKPFARAPQIIAFERTKQYLSSQGFWVDADGEQYNLIRVLCSEALEVDIRLWSGSILSL
jgi:hypothetical protein